MCRFHFPCFGFISCLMSNTECEMVIKSHEIAILQIYLIFSVAFDSPVRRKPLIFNEDQVG